MPSIRGGCGPAHTGSLCISIIILIIVIILIVMVCCNYNYNYNKPPPPRIQNPAAAAAAAAAYKYGMNGGMNNFKAKMNLPRKNNFMDQCGGLPDGAPCLCTYGPNHCKGKCNQGKCYANYE
jgi:hypothetical protein